MGFVEKRKSEFFYKKAKAEKYRARSAYKLLELQKKFHLIKEGSVVVDCGAAPGSWSQVALEFIGRTGLVIGVDILPIAALEGNFVFLRADLTKPTAAEKIKQALPRPADLVMSDAAPEFSGIRTRDIGLAMDLNRAILEIAKEILKSGGNFVCKSFQGPEFQDFVKELKENFAEVNITKPAASLKESSEMYLVGLKFKRESARTEQKG